MAKRYQVKFRIVARLAAQLLMMDLKICSRTTILTSPIVAFKHALAELFVCIGSKPQSGCLGAGAIHEAFLFACSKNACLSCPGRNLKNRVIDCSRISWLPLSRLAPARKSAQIISRQ